MSLMACSATPEAPVPAPATMALIIDVAGFEGWLRAAHAGSRIAYHRGDLGVDRRQKIGAPDNEARAVLHDLATRALRAAEQGLVHLVQRRHGREDSSYLAIKARSSVRAGHLANSS